MLLTERQRLILRDLLNEEKNVVTKNLAEKYSISLRTVRYDLENIEYWLKEMGATLVKTPRVGMRVENKKEAIKAIKDMNLNANEILFSSKDRANIILIRLMLYAKPLTSEKFAEELNVSRSTIISEIKAINEELQEYFISIEGKTNHGFMITGEEKNIRYYIKVVLVPLLIDTYKEKIYILLKDQLFDSEEVERVKDVILLFKEKLNIRLDDSSIQILKFIFIIFIARIKNGHILKVEGDELSRYKTTQIYTQVQNIYEVLISKFGLPYEEGEIAYLLHIMLIGNLGVNSIEDKKFDEEKLIEVVAEIVNMGFEHLNIKESEFEVLSNELFYHLKLTLNKYELNVISENPILEQIKAKYGDVFDVARKTCVIFTAEYGFELNEGEIGFITMYFLKSLERSKIYLKKNIIVVCNTSRGTGKLLATRIKNNIPEINIKDIVSIIDIEKDKELLEDVDLIISTIKIDNLNKATLTVSPIITTYELGKIRDFLYIEHEYVGEESSEEEYVEETLTTIIRKYTDKKNVGKLQREIMSLIGSYSSYPKEGKEKEDYYEHTEFIVLILVEVSDMLLKIYPHGMNQEEFKTASGIIIHITMAIARWQNKEYNPEKNMKFYEENYPDKFKIIEETFSRISQKYKISIKRTEVVAILRYLI